MRSTKAQDYWRKINKNESPLKINRISFENLNGVGSGEFIFSASINGVCGKNGLGKSTLLKAVYQTLDLSGGDRFPEVAERLSGGSFEIELSEGASTRVKRFGGDGDGVNALYLDPSELCHVSLDFLRKETNLEEVLVQYEFAPLDDSSLKEVRRILGRGYEVIEFLEMEDVGGFDILPFFRVTLHDVIYDSRDMALGELAVLYIWWHLWKRIDSPHIVLIEEPENFLTPKAQRYLTDYLAFVAVKSRLWVLLSTHSEHVVENVGLEATSVVVENPKDGSVIVKNPRHKIEFLEHLGLDPRKRGLILVEDGAGKTVFEQACAHFGSFLLHDFEVISAKGSGPIRKLLENFPFESRSVECFGIFDGDERAKIPAASLKNCYFLPGSHSPEQTFELLIREKTQLCADVLKVDHQLLIEKLSIVVGLDEHDWFDDLRKSLGLDYNATVRDLARLWLKQEADAFRELISSLDSSVPVIAEPAIPENGKLLGKVEQIKADQGFGFIMGDDGERLFFHCTSLVDVKLDALTTHTRVSFELQETDRRFNAAVRIRLLT